MADGNKQTWVRIAEAKFGDSSMPTHFRFEPVAQRDICALDLHPDVTAFRFFDFPAGETPGKFYHLHPGFANPSPHYLTATKLVDRNDPADVAAANNGAPLPIMGSGDQSLVIFYLDWKGRLSAIDGDAVLIGPRRNQIWPELTYMPIAGEMKTDGTVPVLPKLNIAKRM